jgi:hypothetical protein
VPRRQLLLRLPPAWPRDTGGDATDDGQEIRFEAFIKQAFGVKVK